MLDFFAFIIALICWLNMYKWCIISRFFRIYVINIKQGVTSIIIDEIDNFRLVSTCSTWLNGFLFALHNNSNFSITIFILSLIEMS